MNALTTGLSFEPQNLDEAIRFSEMLAKSKLVPKAIQGAPSDVLIVLLTGRELGFSPMAALRLLAVIDGKPVISSEAYVALVRSKADCEYFRCESTDGQQATFVTKRPGHPEQRLTWTLKMAAQAQLLSKDNWRKYPEAMLRWRCAGALARLEFAHHFAGVYMDDEGEELREAKDITPAREDAAALPPARGVAALASTVAQLNAAAPSEVIGGESRIDIVQAPAPAAAPAEVTVFEKPAAPTPPVPAAPAAAPAAPPGPKPERKVGQFKDRNISELDGAGLAAAMKEVGDFLHAPKTSAKAKEAAQTLLGELMAEADHRINLEAPEPGSAG